MKGPKLTKGQARSPLRRPSRLHEQPTPPWHRSLGPHSGPLSCCARVGRRRALQAKGQTGSSWGTPISGRGGLSNADDTDEGLPLLELRGLPRTDPLPE